MTAPGFDQLIRQALEQQARKRQQGAAQPLPQPSAAPTPPQGAPLPSPTPPTGQPGVSLDDIVRRRAQADSQGLAFDELKGVAVPSIAPAQVTPEQAQAIPQAVAPAPAPAPAPSRALAPEEVSVESLQENAQRLTAEAGGPGVIQETVTQSVGEAIGAPDLAPEEIQSAIPAMQQLLTDLSETREGIKSELASKIEAGKVKDLTRGEKIATALLLILPTLAGGLLGGREGAGKGLQATGQGLLALNQQLGQRDEAAFQARQEAKSLRKELIQVGEKSVKFEQALSEQSLTKLKGIVGEDLAVRIRAENGDKPLNEQQSKSLAFGTRMQRSQSTLNELEQIIDINDPATAAQLAQIGLPFTEATLEAPNVLRSPEIQRFLQAKRDFLNAVLRKESGAAISEGEFINGNQQYFPQVGDAPEVIQQKRENRQIALTSMQVTSGISRGVFDDILKEALGEAAPAAPTEAAAPAAGGFSELSDEDLDRMIEEERRQSQPTDSSTSARL